MRRGDVDDVDIRVVDELGIGAVGLCAIWCGDIFEEGFGA